MTVSRMFGGPITLQPASGPTKFDDATWAQMSARVARLCARHFDTKPVGTVRRPTRSIQDRPPGTRLSIVARC